LPSRKHQPSRTASTRVATVVAMYQFVDIELVS
jgi:hypothetical protein